jgi:membrane fusion protein (multidrug efflux system)
MDLSQIKIDFTLPERYAADVREGQSFSFTVAGQGKKREGKITVIEPAIDPQTRSLVLRGVCADADGLRPGSFADVTLTLTDAQPTLMVPSTAIIPSPRGHGVYVIDAGKAKFQEVIIGTRTENQVQILSGLTEGNRVATTNLNRIRPGVEVSIVSRP